MNQIEFVNIVKLLTSFTGVKWCLPACCCKCCKYFAVNAARNVLRMQEEFCARFVSFPVCLCLFGIHLILQKLCCKCCRNSAINVAKNWSSVAGFPATGAGSPAPRAANRARIVLQMMQKLCCKCCNISAVNAARIRSTFCVVPRLSLRFWHALNAARILL